MRKYAHARAKKADLLFGQIIAIADTPLIGTKTVAKEWGLEITTAGMIEHRRLQLDARKWLVVKLAPKKYGDKLQVGGADDLQEFKHEATMTLTPEKAYKRMILESFMIDEHNATELIKSVVLLPGAGSPNAALAR